MTTTERLKITTTIGGISSLIFMVTVISSLEISELSIALVTKLTMQFVVLLFGFMIIHLILTLMIVYVLNSTMKAMVQSVVISVLHFILRPLIVVNISFYDVIDDVITNRQQLPANDGSFSSSPYAKFAFTSLLRC